VAELLDFMLKKGLKFAPAVAGAEPAYRHVYDRLRAFDTTPASLVTQPPK
jgi:hypothetical protein